MKVMSNEDGAVAVKEYTGNLEEISEFIKEHGIPEMGEILLPEKNPENYIINANCEAELKPEPWRKPANIPAVICFREADEQNPQIGDIYVIGRDRLTYLYTSGEFYAKYREATEEEAKTVHMNS